MRRRRGRRKKEEKAEGMGMEDMKRRRGSQCGHCGPLSSALTRAHVRTGDAGPRDS